MQLAPLPVRNACIFIDIFIDADTIVLKKQMLRRKTKTSEQLRKITWVVLLLMWREARLKTGTGYGFLMRQGIFMRVRESRKKYGWILICNAQYNLYHTDIRDRFKSRYNVK